MLVPMEVTAQGYRVVYEPRAVVRAVQKKRGKQEFNRRLRVAVRGWSSLPTLLRAVPPWKTPLNWVAQFSHKYLRWLTGFLLIGLLVSNALLWREPVYRWFLVAQGVFYAVAIVGYVASLFIARLPKVLAMPYWFCLVQAAGLVGLIQSVAGRRVATWKPEP